MKNFYPDQYQTDKAYVINHNYLSQQFSDSDLILKKIKEVVDRNDFTLGETVDEIEDLISKEAQTRFAIAVGSGTDALMLSLKALGIGLGDEVITSTYTFYATVGAIVTAGAKPVFCDCLDDYNLNYLDLEDKITSKTRAIIPVHWAGRPCEMDKLLEISKKYSIDIIEDACHALQAEFKGKRCGGFGITGCFSFHPLKNLNVWGDGGVITTNDEKLAEKLKLIRNHGLANRDTCIEFAYNSRLDTVQAVVAKHLLENKLANITETRRANSIYYDKYLSTIEEIDLVNRSNSLKEVFHLYCIQTDKRDQLATYLQLNGIDAKVHYPVPMHLQPAAQRYSYKNGDFPNAENLAKRTISLPVHEYITETQITFVANKIKQFLVNNI